MGSVNLDPFQVLVRTTLLIENFENTTCPLCQLINSTVRSAYDLASVSDAEKMGSILVVMAGRVAEQGDMTASLWRRYGDGDRKINSEPVGIWKAMKSFHGKQPGPSPSTLLTRHRFT